MKLAKNCDNVEYTPSKSAISKTLSTTFKAKPAAAKEPATTTSSSTLQHSATLYRRQKKIKSFGASPQPQMDLKPIKARIGDDISLVASLFSVTNIDHALSMADNDMNSVQKMKGKAIIKHKDVNSGRIKPEDRQKMKYVDDLSITLTSRDATFTHGVSHSMTEITQSMSEESSDEINKTFAENGTKNVTSRFSARLQQSASNRLQRRLRTTREHELSMTDNDMNSVQSRKGTTILILEDVTSGSIECEAQKNTKYVDDLFNTSTSRGAAFTLGISHSMTEIKQSMSDESSDEMNRTFVRNETKKLTSRFGARLQQAASNRVERRLQISHGNSAESPTR
jgi:SOS-response transcriptional repressor LexA